MAETSGISWTKSEWPEDLRVQEFPFGLRLGQPHERPWI
jgi:hypothetical protein